MCILPERMDGMHPVMYKYFDDMPCIRALSILSRVFLVAAVTRVSLVYISFCSCLRFSYRLYADKQNHYNYIYKRIFCGDYFKVLIIILLFDLFNDLDVY